MSERSNDMSRLAAREQESESGDDEGSQQPTAPAGADSNTSTSSDPSSAESASERSNVNVKDRGSNLFMYLPQSLGNEIDLACQSVNLIYQRESGEKLGKNRYLYPIVLMVGVDAATDLSYDEIQDLVERIDQMEDAS